MQIYIAEGTQQTGPFDLDAIRAGLNAGKYAPTQLAWYEGAPGWEPISKLPGMEAAAAPVPPPAPPAPPPMPSYSPAPAPGGYSPAPMPYSPAPYPGAPPPASAYNPGAPPPPYGVAQSPPAPYGSPPPAPYGTNASPPPKTGWWGKIGGVLIGLLAIVGGIARVSRPFHSSSSYRSSSTPTPAYSTYSTPLSTPTPTYSAASSTSAAGAASASTTKPYYNNANQFPAGELQEHYVNFRFNYPSDFAMLSGSRVKHKEDFVEVDHQVRSESVETFYVEDFYFTGESPSLAAVLSTVGPKFIAEHHANSKKSSPAIQLVSEGMTKFKNYSAYEYLSQLPAKDSAGKPFMVYSRYLIVAPPTGKNGVILEIVANSDTPGLRSVNDLGKTPGMATILDSFTFL